MLVTKYIPPILRWACRWFLVGDESAILFLRRWWWQPGRSTQRFTLKGETGWLAYMGLLNGIWLIVLCAGPMLRQDSNFASLYRQLYCHLWGARLSADIVLTPKVYMYFFQNDMGLEWFYWQVVDLTHWGRVTHICVSKQTIIGSDNGLSPGRRQAIIWTNAGFLLIGPLGTNFNEILIKILTFSFKKMRLKVSSAKRRPLCLGLNVLTRLSYLLLPSYKGVAEPMSQRIHELIVQILKRNHITFTRVWLACNVFFYWSICLRSFDHNFVIMTAKI